MLFQRFGSARCSYAAFSSKGVCYWGSAVAAHFNYVNNAAKALVSALQQKLSAALAAAQLQRRWQCICSTGVSAVAAHFNYAIML